MSLLKAARLNALANYANFVVTTLVTLVATPVLVNYLGSAGFGTWKAIQKLMDFGTVADGRSTQALKWVIAANARLDRADDNRKAVGSALLVWLIFLPLTAVVALVIVWLAPTLIHQASLTTEATRLVAGLLALNLALVPLLGLPDAVLVGENRGYASMITQTATFVASNVAMVYAASRGFGLATMASIVLLATVITAILVFLRARRLVTWFGIAMPQRGDLKKFFGFSGWVLVWSFVSKLLLTTDVIILGAVVGASEVTNYTFSAYAAQFAIAICFMTGSAAMPGIGSLVNHHEREKLVATIGACRSVVLALATVLCTGILLFNRFFVTIWAGDERFLGDLVNTLLVISAFQLILLRNESQIQDVTLSIKKKVISGAVFALFSLLTALIFFKATGNGVWAIFAGLILGRLPLTFMLPKMVNALDPGLSREWKRIGVSLIVLLSAAALSNQMNELTAANLIGCILFMLGAILTCVLFVIDPKTRAMTLNRVLRRM